MTNNQVATLQALQAGSRGEPGVQRALAAAGHPYNAF
jgi:hypothetical protein